MGGKFFLIGRCAGFDRHSAGCPEREHNRPARRGYARPRPSARGATVVITTARLLPSLRKGLENE